MIILFFLAILAVSLCITGLYLVFTIWFRPKKKVMADLGNYFPLVTILKPLKNMVDDLAENLESYFLLDYPNYEIIFGVDTMHDDTVPFIRSLQTRFPDVPVSISATGHSDEENPKIFKLAKIEPLSRGEVLWVTDANTRVGADTLNRLVLEYRRSSAQVIFSPIRGTGSRSLASLMENMSLNLFTSGNIITAWKVFKQQIIVGKSMFIEKAALGHFGGFSYFSEYLAEDFMIGEVFSKSGFKLSSDFTWIDNVNRTTTIKSFYQRMARWAKLRLRLKPFFYIMEIVLNPIALSIALPFVIPGKGIWVLAAVWFFKILIEFINYAVLHNGEREPLKNFLVLPLAVVLKDFILLAVYLVPFFSRTIVWYGGNVSIGRQTVITGRQERLVFEGA
jgi:ceramide glucosyltransferase